MVTLTIDWHQQAEATTLIPETGLNPALPQPSPPEQYTLQLVVEPPNSGSVLVEPAKPFYSYGEVVWLTAKPSSGFVFWRWYEKWDVEFVEMSSDNPTGYAVIANRKIVAYFTEQELPSPPPPEWYSKWQGSVPSAPSPPPPPIYIYILLIIPFIMIFGAAILTAVFRRKWLRSVGLILGILGALACLPASFFSCMGAIQSPWSLGLGYVMFSWLIHWIILLVASRWALVGGVLLIVDGSFLAAVLGGELANLSWLTRPFLDALVSGLWSFTFLLLLLAGVLFILAWREGQKRK